MHTPTLCNDAVQIKYKETITNNLSIVSITEFQFSSLCSLQISLFIKESLFKLCWFLSFFNTRNCDRCFTRSDLIQQIYGFLCVLASLTRKLPPATLFSFFIHFFCIRNKGELWSLWITFPSILTTWSTSMITLIVSENNIKWRKRANALFNYTF